MGWSRKPAVGRSSLCPTHVVDLTGGGHTPTSDMVRCSYEDARGRAVRVSGHVLMPVALEGVVELPKPVPDVRVVLVPWSDDAPAGGPAAAEGRTDAQGAFTMDAVLAPGTYGVVAGAGRSRPIEIGPASPAVIEDVRVLWADLD